MTGILDNRKCKNVAEKRERERERERNMLKQLKLDNSECLLRYISDS
jgi:hypothetical protein